jgi:aminopeptidase YwaD
MVELGDLLDRLCAVLPDRRPGSPGNHQAVDLVAGLLTDLGWDVETPEFPVVCWEGYVGRLALGGRAWSVAPSPYALGWQGTAPVHPVSTEGELAADHDGAFLVPTGNLREPDGSELLVGGPDDLGVELLIVNGEDQYAAPGEMECLRTTDRSQVRLAINVDGPGFRGGPNAVSTYGSADQLDLSPLLAHGLVPGPAWPRSDHMVFAISGCPAIALTSWDLTTVMEQVAHSPTDTPDLADLDVLESAARGIDDLVRSLAKEEQR